MGGRAPAYCVATGKALLAHAAGSVLEEVARHLEGHTPRTITDPAVFYKELQKIRENGYAINRGEWRESVHGLAAPILDGHGHAIAAIGISGPSERLNPKHLRDFAQLVTDTARAIAGDLGFTDARSRRAAQM
jgi:DNA-binding IclR family transcriptional regulator